MRGGVQALSSGLYIVLAAAVSAGVWEWWYHHLSKYKF